MAEPALSIRGLTKVYGNGFQALKGIDLDVQQGDFLRCWAPTAQESPPPLASFAR